MLQFPTLMSQFPSSTKTIPASHLLPIQWPQPPNEEILLAMEEAEFEEKVYLLLLCILPLEFQLITGNVIGQNQLLIRNMFSNTIY